MTIVWMPMSQMGRYSLWAAGAFLMLIVMNAVVQVITDPPGVFRLVLVGLAFAASVTAAVLALIGILRERDRAILTFVALVPVVFSFVFELVFE